MQLIDPPGGKPWALLGLCGASILLNVVLLARGGPGSSVDAVATADLPTAEAAFLPDGAEAVDGELAVVEETRPSLPEGINVVNASVSHSLARTFQKADPERADVVSAIYARLFFWDLDLRRDLQKGDGVTVAYLWDGELADIQAARYESNKVGSLSAFKYQAQGDKYASWWRDDGSEAALRLKDEPLRDYEQVTSLLKDRPSHKGMDFKVPVGVDVVSPRTGTVTRTNWNFKYNGNCVEVRYSDGVMARFLHLSETAVEKGQRLSIGTRIGATGNTGRSTAPHLHYELERSGRVLDPVDYHGTIRRSLPASDLDAFESVREMWTPVLSSET